MKKLNLIFVFLFFTSLVFSQTTREEFDYCTKGIKTQIANGLDVTKKGYTLDTLGETKFTYNGDDRSLVLTFIALKSTSAKKTKAIVMVYNKFYDNNLITQEFLCIPTQDASDDLWVNTWQTINGLSLKAGNKDACAWIMYCLMKFVAQQSE